MSSTEYPETLSAEEVQYSNDSFAGNDNIFNCSIANESLFANITNCTALENPQYIHVVANIILQVCYGLAFVIGLLGNSLVIYVILRFSKMQTVTNFYILNLAIADELFVIGIPFLMSTSWIGYWPFGNFACKLYMIVTSLNQFTSSLFLTIMSADRYIAICHPINAPTIRTTFISKVVSATAWTTSALMILPVIIYSKASSPTGVLTCNIFWSPMLQTAFTIYSFVLAFAIPVIFFIVFYTLVLVKLRAVGPKSTRSKDKKKSHRKVTKLVLTVITVYVFCYLPYWVLQLALIYTPPKQAQSPLMLVFFLFSSCLSYANSSVNPILYAFLSDNFKKSFVKACVCATNREVNNALHFETSVFPRRNRRESARTSRRSVRERKQSTVQEPEDIENNESLKSRRPSNKTVVIEEENNEAMQDVKGIISTQL